MTWHFYKPYDDIHGYLNLWSDHAYIIALPQHSNDKGKLSEISYQLTSISDNDNLRRYFSIDIR